MDAVLLIVGFLLMALHVVAWMVLPASTKTDEHGALSNLKAQTSAA